MKLASDIPVPLRMNCNNFFLSRATIRAKFKFVQNYKKFAFPSASAVLAHCTVKYIVPSMLHRKSIKKHSNTLNESYNKKHVYSSSTKGRNIKEN